MMSMIDDVHDHGHGKSLMLMTWHDERLVGDMARLPPLRGSATDKPPVTPDPCILLSSWTCINIQHFHEFHDESV